MKKERAKEKEKPNLIAEFLNSRMGQEFIAWWKQHRHSGYAVKGTETRWGTPPATACSTDRYMAEFCSDRGYDEKIRFDYTAADYERWAQEQQAANEAVAEFARQHGGREVGTIDECMAQIRKGSALLHAKFAVEKMPGYSSLSESKIQQQLNIHMQKFKP